jgi:hypothetical protein
MIAVVIFGALLIGMGALTSLSTLGKSGEEITRGVGLLMASFGGMTVAMALYIEAARMRAEFRRAEAVSAKRNLSPCAVCGKPAATFWCTTHTTRLCPECLPKHDDVSRCLYKTFGRGAAQSAGRGSRGVPQKTRS